MSIFTQNSLNKIDDQCDILDANFIGSDCNKQKTSQDKAHDIFLETSFPSIADYIPTTPIEITCSAEIACLQNFIQEITRNQNLPPKTIAMLLKAAAKHPDDFKTIVGSIQTKDRHTRAIFLEILKIWTPSARKRLSLVTSFLSNHSTEQNQRHYAFFDSYGFYRLLQEDITTDLSVHLISPRWYKDFTNRAKPFNRSALLLAAKMGIYDEFSAADEMAENQYCRNLLTSFLLGLPCSDHALKANLEIYRLLFTWVADHPDSYSTLLLADTDLLLQATSYYLHFQRTFPYAKLPNLCTFVRGVEKSPHAATRLLEILLPTPYSTKSIFNDWVDTPSDDTKTVGDILLSCDPTWLNTNPSVLASFFQALNLAKMPLPSLEMARMLTQRKAPYLMILCDWIKAGHEALAGDICIVYSSHTKATRDIGLLAMHQEVEMARVLFLLTKVSAPAMVALPAKKTARLSQKQCNALTDKILMAVSGEKGVNALAAYIQRRLGSPQPTPIKKHEIAPLLFKLLPKSQEKLLTLCLLASTTDERAHLLEVVATYPSRHLIELLLETPFPKFIKEFLAQTPDPSDLMRVIEVFSAVTNKTALSKLGSRRSPPIGPREVLKSLKKSKPALKKIIKKVLKDTSPVGKRIRIAMADWARYSHKQSLVTFFTHYPLGSRTDAMGQLDHDQQRLWEAVAVRLECGRVGYIEEVMTSLALDKDSLQSRAIEACNALERPRLLRQIVRCDPSDPEVHRILTDLIDKEDKSLPLFLLQIKWHDKNASCQPYLDASPVTSKVISKLVASDHSFLAEQLANNKNLPLTAQQLGFSAKPNPKADTDRIQEAWEEAETLTKAGKEGSRTSLDAYERFRESDCYINEYQEVTLSLAMAEALIYDKQLPISRFSEVLEAIPDSLIGTDHHEYLEQTLTLLRRSDDLRDKITAIGPTFPLSAEGRAIINGLFRRCAEHPISIQEIRLTLLSALLSRPRQSVDEGTCFAAAESIRLKSSIDGLSDILDYYKQILSHGKLELFDRSNKQMGHVPILLRYLQLDLGLPLTHPLAKAFEYGIAARGNTNEKSLAIKARDEIFNNAGFIGQLLTPIYAQYMQSHPGEVVFPVEDLLNALKVKFDESAIELYNPKILINGRYISGWELTTLNRLRPVTTSDNYKQLYKHVLMETLAAYTKQYPNGHSGHLLVHAIREELTPYFDPTAPTSSLFIEHLMQKFSLSQMNNLWRSEDGGHQSIILASHLKRAEYPFFSFKPSSGGNACHHILQYCYNLPPMIKDVAAGQKGFRLPMSIPSHSITFLPHHMLALLSKHGGPKKTLKAIRKSCMNFATKTLDHDGAMKIAHLIVREMESETSAFEAKKCQASFDKYNFSNITLEAFAEIALKESYIACGISPPPMRKMIGLIDEVIWKFFSTDKNRPLFIFGDANWIGDKHNNIFLAFGWSLASKQLEIFITDKKLQSVGLLHWDALKKPGWELYAPPL